MNAAPTDFFRRGVPLLRVVILLMLGLLWAPAAAAAPPADFQTSLVVGDGLNGPSGFEIAPDGRIFILERSGKIKIVKNGQLLPTPFADLPSEDTGDRGLIGIAFDPDFGVFNHYVYFYYTGHDLLNHLVRFSAAGDVGSDAQDLSNPHGKILRINKDGSIPADNPFAGQPGKLGAIWAYGFRNPWRFHIDHAPRRVYRGKLGEIPPGGP